MLKLMVLPYLTEKSLAQTKLGKYTFLIQGFTSRQQVKDYVSKLYNVQPLRVNLSKNALRARGSGRTSRRHPARIKAILTLKPGEKIADFAVADSAKSKGSSRELKV